MENLIDFDDSDDSLIDLGSTPRDGSSGKVVTTAGPAAVDVPDGEGLIALGETNRTLNVPSWVDTSMASVRDMLTLQPSICIHRSKLFTLFDAFRELLRVFQPDYSLPMEVLAHACKYFCETVKRTQQVMYSCSASRWSQTAITWSSTAVKDTVCQIRKNMDQSLKRFGCQEAPKFAISEQELNAQHHVDVLQLKASLIEYLTVLDEHPPSPSTHEITELIKRRINSIGPVDGIQEGPALVCISPFLPPRLNLVLEHSEFVLGDVIGRGTFGAVHVGTMTSNGRKVAVKVMNAQIMGGRQLETFKREVWTMATLNHPSILRLVGVTLTVPFCIVTDLLRCSLYARLKYLTPTKRSIIAFRVAQAMEQLHAARIIHRDLKSGNILLDEDDMPQVCDFGLVGFKKRGTRTGYIGTAQWMAPEILRSAPFYDEKVDVYSFAVLLWEMLTMAEPYGGMKQDEMVMAIIERGVRPDIPPQYGPPKLIELINRCWSEEPVDRPSFHQITAALFSMEVHFVGTNETEFATMSPTHLLSTNIVHAFDCCNWSRLDALMEEISSDQCQSDPELVHVLMALFPSLDSERQAHIIEMLPRIVDLPQFLCVKGYAFIVSLFSLTSIVVEAIVTVLRTIPPSSKGFRQVKLIAALTHARNQCALELCGDLCEFDDIAEQVTEHHIPFCADGMEMAVLYVYRKLLKHERLRVRLSDCSQPLQLSKFCMMGHEDEICRILIEFPILMTHADIIIDLNLISDLVAAVPVTKLAIEILGKVFVACTIDQLRPYSTIIEQLIEYHRDTFADSNILLKLRTVVSMSSEAPA